MTPVFGLRNAIDDLRHMGSKRKENTAETVKGDVS